MLTVLVALVSLMFVVLFAIIASRNGGWRGALFGVLLLVAWVAWLAAGPKP